MEAVTYGFVVHPLTATHAAIWRAWRLGRGAGLLKRYPAFSTRPGRTVAGLLYGVPLLPRPMLEDQEGAVAAIAAGVDDLALRGARAVGLGAVCAVVGSRGRAVAERASVPVTTGHELTAWAAVRTTLRVEALLGPAPALPVAVLGAPWAVAVAVAECLARRGRRVLLGARGRAPALTRIVDRAGAIELVDEDDALRRARLVVSASSGGGILTEDRLAPGTVLVDVARPRDLRGPRTRRDILTVDGETVGLPPGARLGVVTEVYNRLVGQGATTVFACFAAPMIAALGDAPAVLPDGRFLAPDHVDAWGAAAERHGFHVDRLFDRGRALSPRAIATFMTQAGVAGPR